MPLYDTITSQYCMRYALKTQPSGITVRTPASWIFFACTRLAFVSVYFGVLEPGIAFDEKPGFRETRMLIYDTVVQGQTVRGIIDTGSTVSTVDKVACRVDVPPGSRFQQTTRISTTVAVPVIHDVTVSFDSGPTGVLSPLVSDLSTFDQIFGQKIGAIIGMDLLADQVLSIVDGEPTLATSVPETFLTRSLSHNTYSDRSRPMLQIKLPVYGNREFIIDTGYNAVLIIADELAQALVRSHRAVVGIEQEIADFEGKRWDRSIIIQEIDISGVVFRNVPARIGKFNCIGMSILTRLNIAVDFHNQRVYVDPDASTSIKEFPLNASGMHLVFVTNKGLRVQNIRKDSPASMADIQPGDEVLRIGGEKPVDLSLDDLMQIVSRDGQTVRIAFRRSGSDYELDLKLNRSFDYPPEWRVPLTDESEFSEYLKEEKETRDHSK